MVFICLTSFKLSGAEGVRCSEGLHGRLQNTRRVHVTNHGSNRNRNGDNDADPDEHAIPWPTRVKPTRDLSSLVASKKNVAKSDEETVKVSGLASDYLP